MTEKTISVVLEEMRAEAAAEREDERLRATQKSDRIGELYGQIEPFVNGQSNGALEVTLHEDQIVVANDGEYAKIELEEGDLYTIRLGRVGGLNVSATSGKDREKAMRNIIHWLAARGYVKL